MFHMLSKRYYLLSGNCMYYYTHKSDVRPKGVIFLTGFIIEKLKDDEMAHKGYYGFEIMHQDMTTGEHHRSVWILSSNISLYSYHLFFIYLSQKHTISRTNVLFCFQSHIFFYLLFLSRFLI